MAVSLIVLSLICMFLFSFDRISKSVSIALTTAIALQSIVVLIITEFLSAIDAFEQNAILACYGFLLVIQAFFVFRHRERIKPILALCKGFLKRNLWFSAAVAILFAALLYQALAYPPNNWDSLTYHMSRVSHWIANKNVSAYPTNIYRQVWSAPFAEYFIAHTCLLSQSDRFVNTVQLLFFVGSLSAIVGIAENFGLSRRARYAAAIIVLTTPELLLESTTTQNDVVVSFFVIASILFLVRALRFKPLLDLILLGLCAGLATISKGSSYFYLAPVLLFGSFLAIRIALKQPSKQFVLGIVAVPLIMIIVGSGHYYRNRVFPNLCG